MKLSEETKKKISVALKQRYKKNKQLGIVKKLSDEHKKIISETQKGKKLSKKHRKIISEIQTGRFVSKETRRRMSEANKGIKNSMYGKTHSLKARNKMSESRKGRKHTEETKKKMSETRKLYWKQDDYRNKMNEIMTSVEYRKKHSEIAYEFWKTKEYQINYSISRDVKPNKPEIKLQELLDKLFSNEYKYVGDFEFWIGARNPDFMNINGQKKLIELFGDYWHSEKVTGILKEKHEQERKNHFKKYGFDTLVVWERELKNINKLRDKLLEFNRKETNE